MTRPSILGRATRAVVALAIVLVGMLAPAIVPTAAAAGPCGNRGHAYLVTQSGSVYLSGCQDDYRFGVPTVSLQRFDVVQLAGNRIQPGTPIDWSVYFSNGAVEGVTTTPAGNNTVVAQQLNQYYFTGSAPLGPVYFYASYQAAGGARYNYVHIATVQLR